MIRISRVFVLFLALAVGAVHAVGTAFTYQGQLSVSGTPADGPYDFEFRLFDELSGGSPIGGTVLSAADLQVNDGVFTIELDFGLSPFDGSDLWLELRVRDGESSAAHTPLAPRQQLTAVPYAIHAEFVADGTVGSVEINSNEVQRRVTGGCALDEALVEIAEDGSVTCSTDNGDIASVTAGVGLVGGGTSGAVSIGADTSFLQRRVSAGCDVGDAIRSIGSDGSVVCESAGVETAPPGVASNAFFTSTPLTDTVTMLGSQTITAPDDGVVVAIGTGSFNLSHGTSAPTARALFSVSSNLGFHGVRPTSVAAGDQFNNLDLAATAMGVFPVAAGNHEFYLMGSKTSDQANSNANARDLALLLMFFPIEYGPNPL